MKTIALLLVVLAVAHARPDTKYTDKYDGVNVDEILQNQRLLVPYLKCILEHKGARCSPEGKELKSHIREALENNCAKCTDKQRETTRLVIGHLINKEAKWWSELVAKYDPQRRFVEKYEADLRQIA